MPAADLDRYITRVGGFGRYQILLLLTTELSYLICTSSLLSAKFITIPEKGVCDDSHTIDGDTISPSQFDQLTNASYSTDLCNCTRRVMVNKIDFYSLFMQLGIYCDVPKYQLMLNMIAMGGGMVGAISFGFLADRFGRKRMCIISLGILICADFAAAATFHLAYISCLMALIGMACGGVMTGNLAFLMECVGARYRLLCASLNGWPMGMMVMALSGYLTAHWRHYFIVTACLGIPFFVLFFFAYESPRWLIQHNRFDEGINVLNHFASRNKKDRLTETEMYHIRHLQTAGQPDGPSEGQKDRVYTYFDLTKNKTVFKNLLALYYSWFASAIISFGIYFTMGALSGNLFLNFFFLGLFKGTTGIIPYIASSPPFNIGRKPILCTFVIIACASVWICIVLFYVYGSASINSSYLVALTVIGGASIDPIWKINHLYSAELFPTVVRNMARGVCNVGSRTGSALSPLMLYLSQIYFIAPYWIYGFMSIGHVLVSFLLLPETKGKPLPERLEDVGMEDIPMAYTPDFVVYPAGEAETVTKRF